MTSPPPPERPIARGIAGPGLIAQIVVAKFGDHLPLYRQEDFFARHGLHIARSTQCDWVQAAAELLRPLYERQKELLLQSPVLWTDDTPVTLLGGGQEGSRQGRFWAYIGEEYPYSVYDFTESRARDGPANFLQGFQGYLHADAYGGYDHIFLGSNDSIREVACWAHARRKFFEAIHSSPRDVHQLLEWIRQLYDIEDRARTMDRGGASRASSARGGACARSDRDLPGPVGTSCAPQERSCQGRVVRSEPVAGTPSLHDGRSTVDRQQRQRANAPASGDRPKELAVSGEPTGGAAGGRSLHDPRRGQASSDRAVDLPA